MRILLLGKYGQLGWELQRALGPLGEIRVVDYPEIDLVQPESVISIVRELRPQVIINATAYTAVDRAETERELAYAINAAAPGRLAEAAREQGAALLHYSTDYVFDGSKGGPYVETDEPRPLSVYGESKLAGEAAIAAAGEAWLTFRTAWVYSTRRDSFVTKVLQWSRKQTTLKLVTDQVSNPTWARMLAEITAQLLAQAAAHGAPAEWLRERRGLYHLAGSGFASRLEWAQAILKNDPQPEEQTVQEILPAVTADFPTPAQRPLFSALDCSKFTQTFGLRLPDWEPTLRLAMETQE